LDTVAEIVEGCGDGEQIWRKRFTVNYYSEGSMDLGVWAMGTTTTTAAIIRAIKAHGELLR
jgi:hypothetical protein